MKQVKRNKQKIWRKTYGKPFLTKKSMVIAGMARNAASASAQIKLIMNADADTDKFQKGLAIAGKLIEQANHMSNQAKILNMGFATK